MSNISQFTSFEDGASAGERLLGLFADLGTDVHNLEAASREELDLVFNYMWEQNTFQRPYPALEGFFTTILRRECYETQIMEVWAASAIITNQKEYAPVCNFTEKTGIIQFGSSTGDHSDGDAWSLDIQGDSILCVPVGSPKTRDEALLSAYGVLPDLHYFEAYLRRSCEIRGCEFPILK